MCQKCYEKGFSDYPKYLPQVAHLEDYKRGYKTKQNESMDADELEHTFFCEKCYERGRSNSGNGIWAPPMSTKRGHYESYEKGYNQVDVADESKVPEYYKPEPERKAEPKAAPMVRMLPIAVVAIIIIGIGVYGIRAYNNSAPPAAPVAKVDSFSDHVVPVAPVPDTAAKLKIDTPKAVSTPTMAAPAQQREPLKVTPTPPPAEGKAVAAATPKKSATDAPKRVATPAPPVPKPTVPTEAPNTPASPSTAGGRVLTAVELKGKSKDELRFMRNEIFARHGYIFKSQELNNYFAKQPWYKPTTTDVNHVLSEAEKKNVELIKSLEH